jgi:hypothetical protein
MGEYATSHREFILAPLHCFLRHKTSLLFIPTISGEPETISDRLFRLICLGDKGGLVRERQSLTWPFVHDREISSIGPQVA